MINPSTDRSAPAGLNATTPQAAAGTRSEPPPSEPCAARTRPRATCTAAPPEEPPGVHPGHSGLSGCGSPTGSVSTLSPSSGAADLPMNCAPSASSAAMNSSLRSGVYVRCTEPIEVGMPATS